MKFPEDIILRIIIRRDWNKNLLFSVFKFLIVNIEKVLLSNCSPRTTAKTTHIWQLIHHTTVTVTQQNNTYMTVDSNCKNPEAAQLIVKITETSTPNVHIIFSYLGGDI